MSQDTVNTLNLIIQGTIGLTMVTTFLIYFFQLKTMRKGTLGQNSISLINYLQDEKTREARRIVMTLKDKDYSLWTVDELYAASMVCSNYEVLSILIYQMSLVPSDIFIENWGPSIKICYEILKEHIEEMQKPENSGPRYWDNFEKLYKEVVKNGY
ncbi:MAG: hypothetical protein IH620_07480 [Ignavibacterium sp.]|nr:hypothetical protein [Ignavibacterium sp.]